MNTFPWLSDFLERLNKSCYSDAPINEESIHKISERVFSLEVQSSDWKETMMTAKEMGLRYAGIWADECEKSLLMTSAFMYQGCYLLPRTSISAETPEIESVTPIYPVANHMERHTADMFGINFSNHPDKHRWTRHQAWNEKEYPLRKSFSFKNGATNVTPPDDQYPFVQAKGNGVYEIPVGPVHAGIIEPGHFRFLAVGEEILNLEERLGYVHKGIEKLAEGKKAGELINIAGRVSGDSTVSYAWAASMACENAAKIKVPERAAFIRAIIAERERIANHVGDIGAICNDVGFAFPQMQATRLKEDLLRLNKEIFDHRFCMNVIVSGGVTKDIKPEDAEKLRKQCEIIKNEFTDLMIIVNDHSSLHDRLLTTGRITEETAAKLGVTGFVGKGSAFDFDVRRDSPYAPYGKITFNVPSYRVGDVFSRLKIRSGEVKESLGIIEGLLNVMPGGDIRVDFPTPDKNAEGIGVIEGWRGEILTYVRFGDEGEVERFFPRDPSWFSWPALEEAMKDTIVPDFPVCNKSVNASYSGHDL